MSGSGHYVSSWDQPISSLSINLDCLVEQAFSETWETDRSQRVHVNVPFLQSSMNDFSYDIFYFVARVLNLISELVSYVRPEKLILAISGCVPVYRIESQRREFYSKTGPLAVLSQLTCPGTVLTELLDRQLKEWIPKAQDGTAPSSRVNKSGKVTIEKKTILPQDVYYYHYTMPGEASLKIAQALLTPALQSMTGTHIIYSPTSESRMLSLCLFNSLPRVLLAEKNYTRLLVVDEFSTSLPITPNDYAVLLTLFCDNFLPKVSTKSITELADLLGELILWTENGLHLENLQVFLSRLDDYETDYNKIFLPRGNVQEFVQSTGKDLVVNTWSSEDVGEMCNRFYTTVRWSCAYLSLQKVNWDINYPYLEPPSISDLVSHNIREINVDGQGCDYHIYHQLLCQLDRRSQQFAPSIFKELLEQKSELSYLYPVRYHLSDKGVPILPWIQMSLVKSAAEPYLTPSIWDLFNVVTRYEYEHNNSRRISYVYSPLGCIKQGPS